MELSGIINLVLGGGLMATIAAIITLNSTVRKAKADAEKATAEAETVRIDNTEKATRVLIENIVNPLKEELNETRKDLNATKREMARLRKAIDDANSCRYSDNCPVLVRMRVESKDRKFGDGSESRGDPPRRGQHGERCRNLANTREGTDVVCELDAEPGHPAQVTTRRGIHGQTGTGECEGNSDSADGEQSRATGG
ncbi:MAG: hypothetical protein PUG76_00715 [Prevotellaceae bacterium]|nr:hypothetical protein [Prevotellaceae bacterium]